MGGDAQDKEHMKNQALPFAMFAFGRGAGSALAAWARMAPTAAPRQRPPWTGIGGVFFKARDPERLRAWYQEHLGVDA
jgi:hypothetical protein